MKKSLQSSFALVLVMVLMLSISVFAFADNAELPTEYVGYGYGNLDAAAVKMHDLLPEEITLNGISIDLRCEDGRVFIRLMDLASAKLLSVNADKLEEHGLDINQLYISDGVIFVKTDGLTEDEIESIKAKLNEFLQDAGVALSIGDRFELGNSGEIKLYVEIGDFTANESSASTEEAPVEEPVNPNALDVQVGKIYDEPSHNIHAPSVPSTKPSVTTVYVTYGTYDNPNYENYKNTHETYNYENGEYVHNNKSIPDCYIYLVKSADDESTYYYSTDGGQTYYELKNTKDSSSDTAVKIINTNGNSTSDVEGAKSTINNTVISISKSNSKDGEIKIIKYADGTPEYDPDDKPDSEDGYNDGVTENKDWINEWTRYAPEDVIEISSADPNTDDIVDAEEVTVTVKNDICIMPSEEQIEAGKMQSSEE